MTVKELKAHLENVDDNLPVYHWDCYSRWVRVTGVKVGYVNAVYDKDSNLLEGIKAFIVNPYDM